jgi:transaldolase
MKLFIDTANFNEITSALELGVITGVTTNPSIISRDLADRDADSYYSHISRILTLMAPVPDSLVNAEVISSESDEMIKEGIALAALSSSSRVVIKLPMTTAGLRACSILTGRGISVTMTLVFSAAQALLAANAGARYVAPFIGRMDDIGGSGIEALAEIVEVMKPFDTKVLAASVRSPLHVVQAAKAGADIATLPYKVLTQMASHPLTAAGLNRFSRDWNGTGGTK